MLSQGNSTYSRENGWDKIVGYWITKEFSLENGLNDDLKNISSFCPSNSANSIRPENVGLISNRSYRWGAKDDDNDDDDLSDWKYWFTVLSIICGMAMLPILTTGYAIVEKETSEKSGSRNIAFINIFGTVLGPILGIALGSICMIFRENLSQPSDADVDESNWIGAWKG